MINKNRLIKHTKTMSLLWVDCWESMKIIFFFVSPQATVKSTETVYFITNQFNVYYCFAIQILAHFYAQQNMSWQRTTHISLSIGITYAFYSHSHNHSFTCKINLIFHFSQILKPTERMNERASEYIMHCECVKNVRVEQMMDGLGVKLIFPRNFVIYQQM